MFLRDGDGGGPFSIQSKLNQGWLALCSLSPIWAKRIGYDSEYEVSPRISLSVDSNPKHTICFVCASSRSLLAVAKFKTVANNRAMMQSGFLR